MKIKRILVTMGEALRKILALLLVIVFALLIALTLLGNAAQEALLSTETYTHLFQEMEMGERGRAIVADLIITYGLRNQESGSHLGDISLRTWETVAEILIPPDWLSEHLEISVTAILRWLEESSTPVPNLTLDFSPIIETLHSPQGALAVLPLLQNVPPCTSETQSITLMEQHLVSCLPLDQDITTLAQRIADIMATWLPPEVSLMALDQQDLIDAPTLEMLTQIRTGKSAWYTGLELGWRLSLFVLSGYALLQSHSWRHLLQKLPLPLFLGGAVSFLLLISLEAFLRWGLDVLISAYLRGLSLEVQALLADTARHLGRTVEGTWWPGIALLIGGGFALRLLNYGIRKVEEQRAQKAAAEAPQRRPRIRKRFR